MKAKSVDRHQDRRNTCQTLLAAAAGVLLVLAVLTAGASANAATEAREPMLLEESFLLYSPTRPLGQAAVVAVALPTLPPEGFSLGGEAKKANGRKVGVIVKHFKLRYEKHLLIRIMCEGCSKHERVSHGVVGVHMLRGEFLPNKATLIVTVTNSREIGRYLEILDAGTESGFLHEPELCLPPKAKRPQECPEEKSAKAKATQEAHEKQEAKERQEAKDKAEREANERAAKEKGEQEAREKGEREAKAKAEQEAKEKAEREAKEKAEKEKAEQEAKEKLEREEREAKEKDVITSVDNTKGDVGPYEGEFTNYADQPFRAKSDTITYVGVTVGDPGLEKGPSTTDTIELKICKQPTCAEGVLKSANPFVNNYGLTAAEVELAVTPGDTYYLVWTPPTNTHGSKWLTFWHAGASHIVGSQEMEAVVRGYNHAGGGPRREVISYLGTRAPPAPYAGAFIYAYQPFEAASNRITKLGAVVGNPKLAREKVSETIDLRLCETSTCKNGVIESGEAEINNYGVTEVQLKNAVPVIPNKKYYVNWESPPRFEGEPWVTFWLGHGPLPEEATVMQAFAEGYDEGALTFKPTYFTEQPESSNIRTFKEPKNASEEGEEIKLSETVQVTCKVFAPEIQSVEPEGYWYRIHSNPWNDKYYAAANAFVNGATLGGEPVFTDFSVLDC